MQKIQTKILIIAIFLFLMPLHKSMAAFFNPDNIITDEEYTNYNSLSEAGIQKFLIKKGSELAVLQVNGKSVAKIFYDSAQAYKINPELLIATAQKEQSAIMSSHLTDYQKKYLMGYAVFDRYNPIQNKYQGIFKQIDSAAWQFRQYIDHPSYFGYQKGVTRTTNDGFVVTPKNNATAGLYDYTPHAGAGKGATLNDTGNGNFLFWQIWNEWFANTYPNGTLLKVQGSNTIYILQNDRQRPFLSERVFMASKYKQSQTITLTEGQDKFITGKPTIFPDGTLLYDQNGKYFIVSDQKLRKFGSQKVFDRLGYKRKNAQFVDQNSKGLYKKVARITIGTKVPVSGTVIVYKKNRYLISGNQKRKIDSIVYSNQFDSKNSVIINTAAFKALGNGSPVLLRDGTLVKDSKGNLFVIEFGRKRPVTRETFDQIGYKIENVLKLSDAYLKGYQTGKRIKI